MNLNQLEYFVSAAESLNFTKAAKKCFISQTAMSLQMKALEEMVGVPLFIRDKHHVELTRAGQIYLREAKDILKRSEEALRLARNTTSGIEGKLHIGYIRGYGDSELVKILKPFHESYPNIVLNFTRDNASPLQTMLERGDCDLTIAIAPIRREASEMNHQIIGSLPLMAVLYPEHPMAEKPFLTYPDLEHEQFILMQPKGRSRDEMAESMLFYERGGFLPDITGLEQDPETLLLSIALGLGISILPECFIRQHLNNPNLRILPVVKSDGSAETLDFELSWPKSNYNPAIEHLLEFIPQ